MKSDKTEIRQMYQVNFDISLDELEDYLEENHIDGNIQYKVMEMVLEIAKHAYCIGYYEEDEL